MNEAEAVPLIHGCSFTDNQCSSLQFSCASVATLESLNFIRSHLIINDKWNVNELIFKTCLFEGNYRQDDGSISLLSTTQRLNSRNLLSANKMTFNGCQFINNSCRNGGGIYAANVQQLLIDSCYFHNCKASENGGAIYTSAETEVKNTNFSSISASKGAVIYIKLDYNVKLSNIALRIDKKKGQAAIFVTGGDSSKSLTFDGNGCFVSSTRESDDETPDFIESDSPGSIVFTGVMCFSESMAHSVKLPSNANIDEKWFECTTCEAPVAPPSLTPIQPTSSIPFTDLFTGNETDDENGSSSSTSKSKISGGAIAGIVIAVIVVIVLVVLLVLFLIRRRNLAQQEQQHDVASQEIASDNFTMGQETNPIWSEEVRSNDNPIFNPSIDGNVENMINDDPFVKEFEEGF